MRIFATCTMHTTVFVLRAICVHTFIHTPIAARIRDHLLVREMLHICWSPAMFQNIRSQRDGSNVRRPGLFLSNLQIRILIMDHGYLRTGDGY